MDKLKELMHKNGIDALQKPRSVLDDIAVALEASKPKMAKLGGKLQLVHTDGMLVWEIVPDHDYTPTSGSYTAPVPWTAGVSVVAGVNEDYISDGWYVNDDGLVQRCIKSGTPSDFNDPEFWEII